MLPWLLFTSPSPSPSPVDFLLGFVSSNRQEASTCDIVALVLSDSSEVSTRMQQPVNAVMSLVRTSDLNSSTGADDEEEVTEVEEEEEGMTARCA